MGNDRLVGVVGVVTPILTSSKSSDVAKPCANADILPISELSPKDVRELGAEVLAL